MADKKITETDEGPVTAKDYALMSQVAHMYYDLGMLQPEIADKLFFSRSKISRLLKAAKDRGVVEIHVKQVFNRAETVEKKLCSTFGLKDAIVITCFEGGDSESGQRAITDFAADYVSSIIKGNQTIGLTNGETVLETCKKLKKVHNCYVNGVQLMGSFSNIYMHGESRQLVSLLMQVYPGIGHYLNAPIYISESHVRDYMLREQSNKGVFDLMRKCSIILTGIGSLETSERGKWYTYQTPEHVRQLQVNQAAGSICAQYYDIQGNAVASTWNDNCIAMPLEEIRQNRLTVGIASGISRSDAILGALRGGLVNVLISDTETVTEVLRRHKKIPKKKSLL